MRRLKGIRDILHAKPYPTLPPSLHSFSATPYDYFLLPSLLRLLLCFCFFLPSLILAVNPVVPNPMNCFFSSSFLSSVSLIYYLLLCSASSSPFSSSVSLIFLALFWTSGFPLKPLCLAFPSNPSVWLPPLPYWYCSTLFLIVPLLSLFSWLSLVFKYILTKTWCLILLWIFLELSYLFNFILNILYLFIVLFI